MFSKNLVKAARSVNSLTKSTKVSCCVSQRNNSLWTKDKILKSPYKEVEIPNCTLYDYIWQNLEKWPQRTLSICPITKRGYTYEQAFKLSNCFAANLRLKINIKDGDTVAVLLPNVPDYPLVTLGILEAGGVITSINPIYTAHEIKRQLLMSDSKAIVTLPETFATVKQALQLANLEVPIIVVKTNGDAAPEGSICFNELSEDFTVDKSCLKKVRRDANDVCFLPYSSGTTGLPKGVELTHRNIIANMVQMNEPAVAVGKETSASSQDVVMCVLPFFHIYGASVLMFHKMSLGMKLITLAKFTPADFINSLEIQKPNMLFLATPLVILMTTHPGVTAKTYRHLDYVVNGAAPLAISDAERFLEKAQKTIDFRQGYGLTETSPVISFGPQMSLDYGKVGSPLPNTEIRIVDEFQNNLGPNEAGELFVRGPQVMKGYRKNDQANAEAMTADGWFKTGDVAIVDDNGSIAITDRKKELIKVKGLQVSPAELEAVLREHPSVSDAAVIGVPHPMHGECPKAFIVLKKEKDVNVNSISDFVKERVATFKRIDTDNIVFIDVVPKSSAGKILRKELKEKYCQ